MDLLNVDRLRSGTAQSFGQGLNMSEVDVVQDPLVAGTSFISKVFTEPQYECSDLDVGANILMKGKC